MLRPPRNGAEAAPSAAPGLVLSSVAVRPTGCASVPGTLLDRNRVSCRRALQRPCQECGSSLREVNRKGDCWDKAVARSNA